MTRHSKTCLDNLLVCLNILDEHARYGLRLHVAHVLRAAHSNDLMIHVKVLDRLGLQRSLKVLEMPLKIQIHADFVANILPL